MSFDPDPFTQVERAIWDVLEAHTGFTDLVKAANRIKFAHASVPADPIKDSLQDSDLPEVMILPTSTEPSNRTSAGPGLGQTYNLVITTGHVATWRKLYPVKWEVWRALERLNDRMTHRVPFVRKVDLGSFNDGFATGEQPERGPRGWNSVLEIRVLMMFSHGDLNE